MNGTNKALFRFQSAWLTNDSFPKVVEEAWKDGSNWIETKNIFEVRIKEWNRYEFGNIFRKKERIMRLLAGIDKAIAKGSLNSFDELQKSLWRDYEDILIQEELYWAQVARCD